MPETHIGPEIWRQFSRSDQAKLRIAARRALVRTGVQPEQLERDHQIDRWLESRMPETLERLLRRLGKL